MNILETVFGTRVGFELNQSEEPMSNQHSVTKRHRRAKSEKRVDYTARTMAAMKQLEEVAKKPAPETRPISLSPANA